MPPNNQQTNYDTSQILYEMVDCHQAGVSQSLQVPWTAQQILGASFSRDGADLHLDGADRVLVLSGWGDVLDKPYLLTADGKNLNGDILRAFDDQTQFASLTEPNTQGVATIEELKGDAWVTNAQGDRIPLSQGSVVYQGNVIETGSGAHVRIKFVDEAIVTLGSNAHFVINDVYGTSSDVSTMLLSVLKGAFTFVSGLVARDDPETVRIFTPTAEIGIRGTKIVGEVDAEGGLKAVLIEGRIFVSTQDEVFDITIPLHGINLAGSGVRTLIFTSMDEVVADFSSAFSSPIARAQFLKEQSFTQGFNAHALELQADAPPERDEAVRDQQPTTLPGTPERSDDEGDATQYIFADPQIPQVSVNSESSGDPQDPQVQPITSVRVAPPVIEESPVVPEAPTTSVFVGAQNDDTSVAGFFLSPPVGSGLGTSLDSNLLGTSGSLGLGQPSSPSRTDPSKIYRPDDILISDITLALVSIGKKNIQITIHYEIDGKEGETRYVQDFVNYGNFIHDLKEVILTELADDNDAYQQVLDNYQPLKANQYYIRYVDKNFFDDDAYIDDFYDGYYGFLIIADSESQNFNNSELNSDVKHFVNNVDSEHIDVVQFGQGHSSYESLSKFQTRYDLQDKFSKYHFELSSPTDKMRIVDHGEITSLVYDFEFIQPGSVAYYTNQVSLDIGDTKFALDINISAKITSARQTIEIYLYGDIEKAIAQFYKGNEDSDGSQLSINIIFEDIASSVSEIKLILYSDDLQPYTLNDIDVTNTAQQVKGSTTAPMISDDQSNLQEAYITLQSGSGARNGLIDFEIQSYAI